jgi:hypothetical protein
MAEISNLEVGLGIAIGSIACLLPWSLEIQARYSLAVPGWD